MTTGELRQTYPLGVIHVGDSHFVGIVGYDLQSIHVAEPGYSDGIHYQRWTDGDLAARWDGRILVLRRSMPSLHR
jgi:hypothetical protein